MLERKELANEDDGNALIDSLSRKAGGNVRVSTGWMLMMCLSVRKVIPKKEKEPFWYVGLTFSLIMSGLFLEISQ